MTLSAITGATVIDGTGAAPVQDAVLLIDGDRIHSVRRADEASLPSGVQVHDATGRYVIPGMMDANVHLCSDLPDVLLEYEGRWEDLILEGAQITLRAGVTTVFDTWGPLRPLTRVRDDLRTGRQVGSRIFVAGNIIGLRGPLSADFCSPGVLFGPGTVKRINDEFEHGVGAELLCMTPEEVQQAVRTYLESSRVDFVKYLASGHGAGLWHFITFSERVQRAIVEEGHRLGLTVQAHTSTPESLRMELEAGADLLQHGDETSTRPIPDETLQLIVKNRVPVAALVCTERHVGYAQAQPGSERAQLVTVKDVNDRRLIEAGAQLLLTTDGLVLGPRVRAHPIMAEATAGVPDVSIELGESHFLWLQAVVERGMDPMEALMSATKYVADAYGQSELGTLEPGKFADLVILDGDPLEDVRNYRRIFKVMKAGETIDRDSLPGRPVLTEG